MKQLRVLAMLLFVAAIMTPALFNRIVNSQSGDPNPEAPQADKVSGTGFPVTASQGSGKFPVPSCGDGIDCETVNPFDTSTFIFTAGDGDRPPAADQCPPPCPSCPIDPNCGDHAEEAPADFSNDSNGHADDNTHKDDLITFNVVDEIKPDGLGPVYNAQSCRECHQNPVSGAISQITELRAGHNDSASQFFDAPGGSLINDRAINAKVQERVPPLFSALVYPTQTNPFPAPIEKEESVRTFRTSLNLMGDGFVEAVANGTLLAISNAQSQISGGAIHGDAIAVPVLEANVQDNRDCAFRGRPCVRRLGRFGWKDQIASLLTFSGDAYLNEIGITNFLVINENSSLGRPITAFDPFPNDNTLPCDDPVPYCPNCPCGEDNERDIDTFTRFMRATKAPPQDKEVQAAFEEDVKEGRAIFEQMPGLHYSCSACHVPAIVTVRPGTVINGGMFKVDKPLGFKVIRPFSDFLLHDIGTGDGIVQNGGQPTRLKVRTPPLWGVRTRTRLMHDGSSVSPTGSAVPPNGASFTFKEAILRHQGEAAAVTAQFQLLSDNQKRQLIIFLESL
jgi:CxxC motif-containing protein (DUF1111 family)